MSLKLQAVAGDSRKPPAGHDAAAYLTAILPELAKIARQSDFNDLGTELDKAADLARKALVKHAV